MSEPIVLVHGLGGSPSIWDRVRALITGTVLAPEVAGTASIEQDALVLARAIRAAGVGPSVVVGHSRGGLVATSLAEQFPGLVTRLVLVSTPPTTASRLTARGVSERVLGVPILGATVWNVLPERRFRSGLASAFAPGGPVPDDAVRDLVATGLRRFRASSMAIDQYLTGASLKERLSKLSVPVSLVYGLDDRRVDPAAMADSASGARTCAYPLQHEGHGAPWSSADAVATVIAGVAVGEESRPTAAGARGVQS